MTVYLLDIDTFSEYLYEDTLTPSNSPITQRIAALAPGQVVVCAVTLAEVMRGMLNLLQRMEKSGKDAVGYAALMHADADITAFTSCPTPTRLTRILQASRLRCVGLVAQTAR